MTRETNLEPIRCVVGVPVPPECAFVAFVDQLASCWPREYTWAGDVLATIAIEPRPGGRCFERGPHAFQCDWGRVIALEPPHRLVLAWQIGPDREPAPNPEKASEVEVRFVEAGPQQTRVELEHRHFERHGEQVGMYRTAMGSAQGWPYILERYKARFEAN